jgi:hypothetical protein
MDDFAPGADELDNGLGKKNVPARGGEREPDLFPNALDDETLPMVVGETAIVPAFIAAGGEHAGFAFIDFFTAQIRNRNTRAAYAVAVRSFCAWAMASA